MQRFFIGLCTGGFEKTKGLYPCQSQWSDFPRGFLPTCRVGCPILQMSEPMTYHFHRNYLKIFAERLPLQGWAFHSEHFRLVRSYDPSVCSADSSPITHIGAVATVNKTGGSSIFLYNWVSGRNRPTVCSLSSIPNLMQDSLFVPPSVSDTCLSF